MSRASLVDTFEREVVIGYGTLGRTIRVRKAGEEEDIAVKVISLEGLEKDAKSSAIEQVRALRDIHHCNILRYTSIYTTQRDIFFDMKLLASKTLMNYVRQSRRTGGISEQQARNILAQIACGLDHLHRNCNKSTVHGGLCPQNIFYNGSAVRLADYGLYPAFAQTHGHKRPASPYPDPPEWYHGKQQSKVKHSMCSTQLYTVEADIWFLGHIISELCTGHANAAESLSTHCPNYTNEFITIVQQCLDHDPSKRPAATDILRHLGDDSNTALPSRRANSFVSNSQLTYSQIYGSDDRNKGASICRTRGITNEICLSTVSSLSCRVVPNPANVTDTVAAASRCRATVINEDLTISQLATNGIPSATSSYYFLYPQWSIFNSIIATARKRADNSTVFLEILNLEALSVQRTQVLTQQVARLQANPCDNVETICGTEQWKHLYICELEYPRQPTLRAIINEYARACTLVPESMIWHILLDVATGLLHLLQLGISYDALLSSSVVMRDGTAVLTHVSSASMLSCSKKSMLWSIVMMVQDLVFPDIQGYPNATDCSNVHTSSYSQDLQALVKSVEEILNVADTLSMRKILSSIKKAALSHYNTFTLSPFSLGAPKQFLTLVDDENEAALERHVVRVGTCPPGAMVHAIKKQKARALLVMCKAIGYRKLQTRVPRQLGVPVDKPTPLMLAVQDIGTKSIRTKDGDVSYLTMQHNGVTALMISAYRGRTDHVFQLLVEMGIQSDLGTTALMFAVSQKHNSCAKLLLPEIGLQQADGTTALMIAVEVGNYDMISLLLPELHMRDSSGRTAYDWAVELELSDYIDILAAATPGQTAILKVEKDICIVDPPEKASYTLIQVNTRDVLPPGQFSNLMLAACSNDVHSIQQYGKSEAGLINTEGKTALMFAAELGNLEATRKLAKIESGMKAANGDAAIFFAVQNDHYRCAASLFSREGKLTNRITETPLQLAERLGHTKCVQAMLQAADDARSMSSIFIGSTSVLTSSGAKLRTKRMAAEPKGTGGVVTAGKTGSSGIIDSISPLLRSGSQCNKTKSSRLARKAASTVKGSSASGTSREQAERSGSASSTSPVGNKQRRGDRSASTGSAHSKDHPLTERTKSREKVQASGLMTDTMEERHASVDSGKGISKGSMRSRRKEASGISVDESLISAVESNLDDSRTSNDSEESEEVSGTEEITDSTVSKSSKGRSKRGGKGLQTKSPILSTVYTKQNTSMTKRRRGKQGSKINDSTCTKPGAKKVSPKGKLKGSNTYVDSNHSESSGSAESIVANEDISLDVTAELAKTPDFTRYSTKIAPVLLKPSQRRKSRKARVSKVKTQLIIAVEQGDKDEFQRNLKMDVRKSYNGLTALMTAVRQNNLLFISILVHYEYGIGQADGTTALMMATEKGLLDATHILMSKEAGVVDKRGKTALIRVLESDLPHVCVQALAKTEGQISRRDGQSPMMLALESGIAKDILSLIPSGTGLTNKDGHTALMIAAMRGHAKYVEVLLCHEAQMCDKRGMTALMHTAAAGHIECVRLLIPHERGIQSKQHCTALHYAVENNRVDCVEALLSCSEEDVPNGKGLSCIDIANARRFHECAKKLMSRHQ